MASKRSALQIQRGTTPTLEFLLDIPATDIRLSHIAFNQGGKTVLEKKQEDLEPQGNTLILKLSEDDTLSFTEGPLELQIRPELDDGVLPKTPIIELEVTRILKDGKLHEIAR